MLTLYLLLLQEELLYRRESGLQFCLNKSHFYFAKKRVKQISRFKTSLVPKIEMEWMSRIGFWLSTPKASLSEGATPPKSNCFNHQNPSMAV